MINIFIPTYNGECHLEETLDSILAQSYPSWKLYCVDDSSTDGTFRILQKYEKKDPRISIFQKQHGGDAPHSWQFVAPYLLDDFTLYMSQDDLLRPDTLEKLILRQQATGADAVIPSLTWYYGDDGVPKTDRGVNGDLSPILSGKEAFELMMDYSIPGFALWRTSIIKANPVPLVAFNSDEYSQRNWCSRCKLVAFSDGEFLYRQNNPAAITHQFTIRHLEASATDAMVLQRAIELGLDEKQITSFANEKYKDLWAHAAWSLLYKKQIPLPQRKHIRQLLSGAYKTIHRHISLSHWKYRWSSLNILLFWIVIRLKTARTLSGERTHTFLRLALNQVSLFRLKLYKKIHHIKYPIVHYYAVCWNEEKILPFLFDHYSPFVDRFTFYDNHSTDSTLDIINARKDTSVIEFDSDGFCDNIHNEIKNNCWKKSRGHADYVIVCDMDEFLYHPDIRKTLADLRRKKISVVKPAGYNMYSETYPDYRTDTSLTRQITSGLRDPMFDKCILFDPHKVVEINFRPGAHECHPWGNITISTDSGIKLLHYKNLGITHLLERNRQYAKRLSKDNIENRYGIEYLRDDKAIADEFQHKKQLAIPVINPCQPSLS